MPERSPRTREGSPPVRAIARARRKLERDEVRRFTTSTRARRHRWWFAAALAAAVTIFVLVAFFSPITAVRTIAVEGNQRLTDGEIEAALADLEGRPLAQVDSAAVAERLSSFVLVQSYSVQLVPPSTIVVHLVERQPVGIVPGANGENVVDAAGVVLWQASEQDQLPTIEAGELTSEQFHAASQVALTLGEGMRASVAKISAASANDVRLTLRDSTEVVWGGPNDSARKAEVLTALQAATKGQGVSVYDVSSPDAPVTR